MKWLVAAAVIVLVWVLMRRPRKPVMAAEEIAARRTLGVSPRADAEEIRAAHRRMLAAAHPDRGGSGDKARRLNAARDLLLK